MVGWLDTKTNSEGKMFEDKLPRHALKIYREDSSGRDLSNEKRTGKNLQHDPTA